MDFNTEILRSDNTYCINLINRTDRYNAVIERFKKQGIDPIFWQVMPHNIPEIGCFQSHTAIIKHAQIVGKKIITVFEDDVVFLITNVKGMVNEIMNQLPNNWEILYLCANTHLKLKQFSDNLFVADTVYNTAAIVYNLVSIYGKYECFKHAHDIPMPYDKWIAETVQPYKKCFVAYPLICTQEAGYSDIAKGNTDYLFIEERYKKFVK
jgi:GR25 family glycosyltransferase involved in LPS biosynthesis